MKEIAIQNKEQYFRENYPFYDLPRLSDKKRCVLCGKVIAVADYKVFTDDEGYEMICCPNAPSCEGTVVDWTRQNYD